MGAYKSLKDLIELKGKNIKFQLLVNIYWQGL